MSKRTFLFINQGGDFLSLHQRILEEGFDCISWYSDKIIKGNGLSKGLGKGMGETTPTYGDVLNKFKNRKDELIILIDDNGEGDLINYLHSEGWKTIGSSAFSDIAEHNRDKGNQIAKKIGLSLPATEHFEDFRAAKEYLKGIQTKFGTNVGFYFKGDGIDLAGSSKTYGAKSVPEMIWYLDWIQKDQSIHHYTVDSFELQLVIDGLEADWASWFNGKTFAPAVGMTFEQKKVMGMGAASGCTGQVFTYFESDKSNYFKEYFTKLEKILAKEGIANEWAINNIVSNKDHKPYFLEFTPRFGWDSTFGELSILQDAGKSIAEFFIMIAEQKTFPKDYFPIGKYSAAVRLYSEGMGVAGEKVNGKPINWDKSIEKNLWWYSIRRRDDGRHEITDNPIGVATFVADTVQQALDGLYSMLSRESGLITHPDLTYSTTIGKNVESTIQSLTNWKVL